jgi:protein O-mannosyl-transferase
MLKTIDSKMSLNKKKNIHKDHFGGIPDKRTWILLGIILLITSAVYFQGIFNDFTHWDDPSQVYQNPDIRSLKFDNIQTYFTKYYVNMYQPLTTLSFAVEYHFFGLNPKAYHATNLVLHLFNVVLVFYFVLIISKRTTTALIVACLFGIHPMHVEAVAWITSRKDVLYTFFYIGSIISFIKYVTYNKHTYYWISLFLFVFSLLSKSTAVTLPVILLLIDWYKQRDFRGSVLYEKIPFLVLSFLFGIISLISQQSMGYENDAVAFKFIDRLLLAAYSLGFYFVKLFIPINLSVLHAFEKYDTGYFPNACNTERLIGMNSFTK